MIWETEENIGSERRKLKFEKGGNDSLSHEDKEEIQVILHKPMDLLNKHVNLIIMNINREQ